MARMPKEYEKLRVINLFDDVLRKYKEDLKDLDKRFVCRSVEIAEILGVRNKDVLRSICTIIFKAGFIVDDPSGISHKEIKEKAHPDTRKSQGVGRPLEKDSQVPQREVKRINESFERNKYRLEINKDYFVVPVEEYSGSLGATQEIPNNVQHIFIRNLLLLKGYKYNV